jgi:hypothetical protein
MLILWLARRWLAEVLKVFASCCLASLSIAHNIFTARMQPTHGSVASSMLPDVHPLSATDTIVQPPVKDACPSTNDPVSSSYTPMHSVTPEDLFILLDKINAEMIEEVARITAAIGEVEASVKLLRFDRLKACVRSAKPFVEDEGRNNLQIL